MHLWGTHSEFHSGCQEHIFPTAAVETVRHEDRVKGWSLMPGNGQAETWQSLWKGRGISDGAEVGTDCKIRRIGWMLGRQQ